MQLFGCCRCSLDGSGQMQRSIDSSAFLHPASQVTGDQQVQTFSAQRPHFSFVADSSLLLGRRRIPASWNVFLPNFGLPKLSSRAPLDRQPWKCTCSVCTWTDLSREADNVQPAFYGRAGDQVRGPLQRARAYSARDMRTLQ